MARKIRLSRESLIRAQQAGYKGVCTIVTARRNGDHVYRAARIDWLLRHNCEFPTWEQTQNRFRRADVERYKLIHYKDLKEMYADD